MDTLSFIDKAKKIHGDKYDYSLSIYTGSHGKVIIGCPIHGKFLQQATCHINVKMGCPKCSIERKSKILREKFTGKDKDKRLSKLLIKLIAKHGNKYDYSKINFINLNNKITIICPKHGEFKQLPLVHQRHGCPKCAIEQKIKPNSKFINHANIVHNNKYDYSLTNCLGNSHKLTITCPIHGIFRQLPRKHLLGQGCPKCGHEKVNKLLTLSDKEFFDRSTQKHGDTYSYNNSKYVNYNQNILITCFIHGDFYQTPHNHIKGHGCPKCAKIKSKEEEEVAQFLKDNNVNIIKNDRKLIKPKELDIYIPEFNLAIEYHGVYWHSYKRDSLYKKMKLHKKHDLCLSKGIKLLQILDYEWNNKNSIVKSMLLNSINKSIRIYARNCTIKELNNQEFRNFMNTNHLHGDFGSRIKIGLIYNNELMCCMGFNKHNYYSYEITRYANKLNSTITGGASKILSYFINKYNPLTILTYANRRYSTGNLYEKLGFKNIAITKPNYFYVKGSRIYSRQKFQKHKLKEKLHNFDINLSESKNMINNGYKRFWDAGNYKFVLNLKDQH
jgi:hypothetical protein